MEQFENGIYRSLVPRRLQPQNERRSRRDAHDTRSRGKKKKAEPPPPSAPPAVQEVHIQQEPTPLFAYAYTYLAEYYSALLMASFVPFLVYFLLSWRDHIRCAIPVAVRG